jgi:hypothetical protein
MVGKPLFDTSKCSVKSIRPLRSQSLLQLLAEQAVFEPVENNDFALFLA